MIEELEWGGVAQYHRELEAYKEWMKNDYIARIMLLSSMQMISWSNSPITKFFIPNGRLLRKKIVLFIEQDCMA